MTIRALAPLVALVALALPGSATAAVRCVGTSGGNCTTTHPTTDAAVTAAVTGVDTIRFGAGVFGPVDTPKVLTWVGVGAGTPDSAAGATVIQQTTASEEGMNLLQGGTVRSLRVQGGPSSGMNSAGAGISFAPTSNGDMSLTVVDVIATGGATAPPAAPGGAGLAVGSMTTGSKTVTVTGGAFLGSSTPTGGGLGVYACCIQTTIRDALIRTAAGAAMYASIDSAVTLDRTTVEGVTGIQTQGPAGLTLNRSRVNAVGLGLFLRSELGEPTNVSLRNSVVTGGSSTSETAAAVSIVGDLGSPVVFEAAGSTLIGRGTSHGVHARRVADGSAAITTRLRNSVARAEGAGVDLLADRATIDAAFSSFNSRTLENGGAAPAPGSGSNVAGNPLLTAGYSLQAGSPLIDRGDPILPFPGELDFAGAARALDGNGDCVPVPDIGAFERPDACKPPANAAPSLTNVNVTNKVFAPRGARAAARRRRVKRGTRFRYTLSEPARVSIRIERKRSCRRSRPRCKRFRRVTVLRANKQGGRRSTKFSGRVKRRALRAGRYRARLVAVDSQGARSRERRVAFRIVRP